MLEGNVNGNTTTVHGVLGLQVRAPREPLAAIAKRLRATARAHVQTQYDVAAELVRLAESWDDDRTQEAGGRAFAEWLAKEVSPTKRISHYKALVATREVLGTLAETMTPQAGLWLYRASNKVRPEPAMVEKLREAARRQSKIPLTGSQVRTICPQLVGRGSGGARVDELALMRERIKQQEERIGRLEAQIRAAGLTPED